ncbi:MAG: hypothetical protein HGA37_05445 [Lentimicrobium sp.]|nr:hypothetical protein [Lentimicrobium sp.]
MKNRSFVICLLMPLIFNGFLNSGYAQTKGLTDGLVPWDYVNQTVRKVSKQVMGIESSVNVNIVVPLNEYNGCQEDAFDGRMDADIRWYNTGDETGSIMLKMLKDMDGIAQDMESFKNKSGFEVSEAKEEDFAGGTLWMIDSNKPCINEITGPTGKTVYNTHIRYFLFTGTTIVKIEIQGLNNPGKTKEILTKTLGLINDFDFSALKSSVGPD